MKSRLFSCVCFSWRSTGTIARMVNNCILSEDGLIVTNIARKHVTVLLNLLIASYELEIYQKLHRYNSAVQTSHKTRDAHTILKGRSIAKITRKKGHVRAAELYLRTCVFPAHNLNTLENVITHLEMFTLHSSKNPVKISVLETQRKQTYRHTNLSIQNIFIKVFYNVQRDVAFPIICCNRH